MRAKILLFLFASSIFLAFPAIPIIATGNLSIGEPCNNNSDCASGDCEDSNISGSDDFCVCKTSQQCAERYIKDAPAGETWECINKADNKSHDLHYCTSNLRGPFFPITPADSSLIDYIDDLQSAMGTEDEIKTFFQKPQPRISIPGLRFSDVTPQGIKPEEIGLDQSLYVPFIGEYIAAVYRYAMIIAGIIAVVFIILGGFRWTMSGGSPEKIKEAQKYITNALTGLTLLIGSYTILYAINPNLLSFKNLLITYVPTEYNISESAYVDKEIYEDTGTSRPISNTDFDPMFKEFANCINVDWRILKVFAFKESRLNPTIRNKKGFTGLFQTKPGYCRDALKEYPEWKTQCNDLTNPYVNTAVGTTMLKNALDKIKKTCDDSVDPLIGGALLYLNHNSGGAALNYLLAHNGCFGGSSIQEGIVEFWNTYKGGKYRYQVNAENRGKYAVSVAQLMKNQGINNFFDTTQNGNATCPWHSSPPDGMVAKNLAVDSRFANPEITCEEQYEGSRVLVLGDSFTAEENSYINRISGNCPRMQFQKIAESGQGTAWMYNQIEHKNLKSEGYNQIIVFGGINTISNPAQVQDDLRLMYNKAKQDGLRVIAITLSPWSGYSSWTPQKQTNTETVNAWIRAQRGGLVDVVVDWYAVAGRIDDPKSLNETYETRDHLHLDAEGQTALAIKVSREAF